jgi:hypothetical protein
VLRCGHDSLLLLLHPSLATTRWRHFDSAAMNERPDLPLAKQQQAGFIPQFDVTGQHTTAFHMDTTACEGECTGGFWGPGVEPYCRLGQDKLVALGT